jgi:uncharacterized protein
MQPYAANARRCLTPLLLAVLTASLVGSLHCAGMCGPFVALATLRTKHATVKTTSSARGLQFAYHVGRLLAYASLGVLAGMLGAALNLGGSLAGIGRLAGLGAGLMLVVVGTTRILTLFGLRMPQLPGASWLSRAVAFGHATATRYSPLHRAWAIGLLTAVLPCGWLYAFVAVAAGTGDAFGGFLTMVAFWVGTVPILAGLGAGLGQFLLRAGRSFQLAIALVVIGLGLSSIAGRWTLSHRAAPTTSLLEALQRVKALSGHGSHPCH